MAGILNWIKQNTSKLMDPDREARVERAAAQIEHELAARRRAFSLEAAVAGLGLYQEDVPLAARHTYRSLVQRAWRDGEMSDGEKKTLKWAAGSLGLSEDVARELQRDVGIAHFQEALARAMDDGVLTDGEIASLRKLATNLGYEPNLLMRHYFRSQCEGLLRGMFLTAIADGRIAADEWARLVSTAGQLGVSQPELLETIQNQAERFVEQTLADMKMDEEISPQEEELLNWLLSSIIARPEFGHYVRAEVAAVKRVAGIESGRLPSIESRRLGLRAGEIVHAESTARFARTRQLKNGPRTDVFAGRLTLTDDRLLFDSPQLGLEVNHRRVLDIRSYTNAFELAANGKGTGFYYPEREPQMFARMYRVAVRKANQTIVVQDEKATRHIPRDVRQRVWQRYGGQCAECGATDYLEFDHVIPFARGGSSAETNVQLLCRRCNGKKSDMI